MSVLSNELDQSFFNLATECENKSTSNVSLQSKLCFDEFRSSSVGYTEEDGESEKGDRVPESFKTSLWSDNESTQARSTDSWDLPLGPIPWDDNDKPIERLLSYADLMLTEEEEDGLLTDRIVAACSSYLTKSPGNKCHIVAKVSLNNKNLNDIRILGYHRFLQYVDLSWNNLTDLTPLGCLPYLMYLDVSHNLLEEVLRFRPPLNLTYVNYSHNEVWQIDDLTDFWALSYLDLSHNKISKIQGLHDLRYLRHLDLSHNKIERFENLNYLRITDLNLEYNLIKKFEQQDLGMKTLSNLMNVYLNNNLITSLEFLKGVFTLKKLELQNNDVSDPVELSNLKHMKSLRQLDLSGNPVSELKPYRNLILTFLQNLKFLDQSEVDISERVAACKNQKFDVQLEAARNSARMILLEQLNDTSLDLDVLPVDQGPYPFVILVGPSASFKKTIVTLLSEKYPEKIHIGKLHTTREVTEPEKSILVHLDVEDFNESVKEGKFLSVSENLGQLYGFSREQLALAVKEHKLCLTTMDMVGALTIHSYGIQPFLVLAIPQNNETHTERLKKIYGPVISSLGATYIAQRQFAKSRSNIIKQVESILGDILKEVFERVADAEGFFCECSEDSCTDTKSFPTESPSKRLTKFPSKPDCFNVEDTKDPNRLTNTCFTCSPTRCDYQESKLRRETECSMCNPEDSKRSSTYEDGSLNAETSYSATIPCSRKTSGLISDEDICGENDPFLNWDMPFVDWSEVNLTSMELEEAGEVLCEKYIESVMSTRDVYQNLHLENPGLFSLSVYTDDMNKAIKDIAKFLKNVWRSTPKRQPVFNVENDLVYQAFVPRKLEKLKEMLRNDFLSADGDGTFKGLNSVAPITSPMSVCAEMHMKGYGDFADDL